MNVGAVERRIRVGEKEFSYVLISYGECVFYFLRWVKAGVPRNQKEKMYLEFCLVF